MGDDIHFIVCKSPSSSFPSHSLSNVPSVRKRDRFSVALYATEERSPEDEKL